MKRLGRFVYREHAFSAKFLSRDRLRALSVQREPVSTLEAK